MATRLDHHTRTEADAAAFEAAHTEPDPTVTLADVYPTCDACGCDTHRGDCAPVDADWAAWYRATDPWRVRA